MSITKIDNIGIATRDVREVAAFLADRVGLEVTTAYDTTPPSATVAIGNQYLYLFQTDAATGPEPRSLALAGNRPGIDHISMTVDDVDATFRELAERGIPFEGAPDTDETWNIRLVGFKDPEGNSYFLVQNL